MTSFDDLFDCHVINLSRQPERWQSFQHRNLASGIHFQRFEAIEGAQCPPVANYSPGAIGNAMSHLALWRHCAELGKSLAVFEDDAVVRHDIRLRLPSLMAQAGDSDIILLGYNTDAPLELNLVPGVDFGVDFSIRFPNDEQLAAFAASTIPIGLPRLLLAFGICGYAITAKGAKRLIELCWPLDSRKVAGRTIRHSFRAYSLDCVMATVYRSLTAYACLPPLVMTPNDPTTSTTRSRNSLAAR